MFYMPTDNPTLHYTIVCQNYARGDRGVEGKQGFELVIPRNLIAGIVIGLVGETTRAGHKGSVS
jgi:hypothetical protein